MIPGGQPVPQTDISSTVATTLALESFGPVGGQILEDGGISLTECWNQSASRLDPGYRPSRPGLGLQ